MRRRDAHYELTNSCEADSLTRRPLFVSKNIPGLISVGSRIDHRTITAAGRIRSIEKNQCTNYETRNVFSFFLQLSLSSIQILSSGPCVQTGLKYTYLSLSFRSELQSSRPPQKKTIRKSENAKLVNRNHFSQLWIPLNLTGYEEKVQLSGRRCNKAEKPE
jgi:hypothetical protein